ncbi:MAG: hypothetical protein VCB63_13880, partial [Alphaproteobacteria bacterium]
KAKHCKLAAKFCRALHVTGSRQMGGSRFAAETGVVVTAAEHRTSDGLVGTIAMLLTQERPTPMRPIGILDVFALVDPTAKVREHCGLSEAAIP